MTYKQLLDTLNAFSDNAEIMGQDVTVQDTVDDEYYGVKAWYITDEDDVLDKGHLVLEYPDKRGIDMDLESGDMTRVKRQVGKKRESPE